jgi:hypothetical protein
MISPGNALPISRSAEAPQVVELMSLIAGDPHRIFIMPPAATCAKAQAAPGEVYNSW